MCVGTGGRRNRKILVLISYSWCEIFVKLLFHFCLVSAYDVVIGMTVVEVINQHILAPIILSYWLPSAVVIVWKT